MLTAVPLLLLLISTGAAASASPSSEDSSPASGTEFITLTSTLGTSSGGDTILYQLATVTSTGTFAGSAVGEDIVTIHPDGTFNVKVVETFSGTVLGSAPGTATIERACKGTVGTSFTCVFAARHGTGGLAGLRAKGTSAEAITGPNTIAGTYTGTVSFASDDDDDGTSNSAQATMRSLVSASSDDSGDQASGTATVKTTTSTRPVVDVNGKVIIYFLFTVAFTGTISGNAVGEGVLVIFPPGTVNVEAVATFTGKILDRTGTATLHVIASGTSASQTGPIKLNHGTGELRGVEVEASSTVTSVGPGTLTGTYNGDVQFDD